MLYVNSYVPVGDRVLLVDSDTGTSASVFPWEVINLVKNGTSVYLKKATDAGVKYLSIVRFASALFSSRGFETNIMQFNGSLLMLVSCVNTSHLSGHAMSFLGSFIYYNWSTNIFAVPLDEYRNIVSLINFSLGGKS